MYGAQRAWEGELCVCVCVRAPKPLKPTALCPISTQEHKATRVRELLQQSPSGVNADSWLRGRHRSFPLSRQAF